MKKEMLINVLQPEECRIAILENGVLEELYLERASQESYVNNIYKGRIVNIESSIQAAFVDFGIGRNGFLHVSDVDPVYYQQFAKDFPEANDDFEDGPPPPRNDRGGNRGGRNERNDGGRPRGDRPERGPREDRAPRESRPPRPERPAFTPVEIAVPIEAPAGEEPPLAEVYEELVGGFGEGIDLDADAPPAKAQGRAKTPVVAPEPPDVPKIEGEEGDADKPKRRRAAKKPVKAAEKEEEKAAPKKRGRGKAKKEDGEPEPENMPSAESRTTEDGDGFGGGIFFDPDAPNDRFDGTPSAPAPRAQKPSRVEDDDDAHERVEPEADFDEVETAEAEGEDETDADLDAEEVEGAFAPQPRGDRRNEGRGDRGDGNRDRGPRNDRGPRGNDRGPRKFSRDGNAGPKPPIEKIFKRGQEIIVQVIKEGVGTKGPTLSTYISIAGRYLVLMPSLDRLAVSRKIEDPPIRARLKEALADLHPPKGIGFIIRTAAIDRNKKELQNDLAYLVRLWEVFVSRVRKKAGPVEIYRESDMVIRTIRDNFTSDIETIHIDEPNAFTAASEFLKFVMPRYADRIKLYDEVEPLFQKYRVEEEIAKLQEKKLPLPLGGSIVIEQTEALVAIDVNSGNFRSESNAEETAYKMNMQAAKEIARQLRLRDLGGVIVNDFIDMKDERHRRSVEKALSDALARDRAKTKILKISAFGVIEMTRQRIRPSLKRSTHQECGHCRGTGGVKTPESMGIDLIRLFQLAAFRKNIQLLNAHVQADVAHYLLNRKRKDLSRWEESAAMQIVIHGRSGVSPEFVEFHCLDSNGTEVRFGAPAAPPAIVHRPEPRPERDREERGGGGHQDRGPRDNRGRDNRGNDRGGDRRGGGGGGGRGGDRRGGGGRR